MDVIKEREKKEPWMIKEREKKRTMDDKGEREKEPWMIKEGVSA